MQNELSQTEIQRYSRQLILGRWSAEKQKRLRDQCVLLSSQLPSALLYLAAAGVGEIIVFGALSPFLSHAQNLNPEVKILRWDPEQPLESCSAVFSLAGEVSIPNCKTQLHLSILPDGSVIESTKMPRSFDSLPSHSAPCTQLQGGALCALEYIERLLSEH